ncbi:MAG: VIT family protein [Bacteroidota bacterium]
MNLDSENHFVNRSNWLRAAILGANDGILSTASIIIGVAAAATTRESIVLAGIAGLVAGALSMAAGEYVSVSSQSDIETADLKREQQELDEYPEEELQELAKIYSNRGLTPELSLEVAIQLTQHNALEAHARDELGINDISQAKPLQAAFASGAAFIFGGILPIIVAFYVELNHMIVLQYSFSILFLAFLGAVAAKTGGSSVWKSVVRITFWGTLAMLFTALIGYLFGVSIS